MASTSIRSKKHEDLEIFWKFRDTDVTAKLRWSNAPIMPTPTIAAIILAAGRGERAGSPEYGPKQYRVIGGTPVIALAIEAFSGHPAIGHIVVVIHKDDHELFAAAAGPLAANVLVVDGGSTRQLSTLEGLRALNDMVPDYVMIHDAARPFVSRALLDRIVEGLAQGTGVLPALPVSDTIKRSGEAGYVVETVARECLFAAQTPQAFPYLAIRRAHEEAHEAELDNFTDDAAIAEWGGIHVKIVDGTPENVKLTWPRDIEMANLQLSTKAVGFPDVRTGTGYDVHSLCDGDHVTLCGVAIPHEKALSGHSDADVGLHALTDALLATCGAGDIGTHFPPSDEKWKGADSTLFLRYAAELVRAAGGRIANADVTLICEAPKIGPHRQQMIAVMAEVLEISQDRISVKATTNEKIGFVGRREGIAAIASASVVYPGEVPG
jgi:2-C-methyl-D-erythritol 4-phosphate cytidylyltransferase/2-C-methyl-D-erythritol 2,4-cyclodiphosphate synthase